MQKTDSIGRRCRTARQPRGKRIGLRPRDLLWFQKLHEQGPLPTSYLYAFSEHLSRDRTRTLKRLADLYNEGRYLERPPQQFHTIDARYNQLVYTLDERGTVALKEAGAWSDYVVHTGGPWTHRLMVSCITASLELAADARTDLRYIPQHRILEHANVGLDVPVTYDDPITRIQVTRNLIPDAICGIKYQNDGQRNYRFFAIEADRNTEPNRSHSSLRKSFMRSVAQYREFIGNGRYKEHFNLTAPMLVLFVTTNRNRMDNLIKTVTKLASVSQNTFMCFQSISEFERPFKPPTLLHTLFSRPWQRSGHAPFDIDRI